MAISFAVIIINSYEKFRSEQAKRLGDIFQNIYLNKTLQSISSSLIPRFEKVNHIIRAGESFETILNHINFDEAERKKILDFIIKNKIKLKLYENQKLIFEIDNLNKKKITKITIPINKKRDLIIALNSKNSFYYSELIKEPLAGISDQNKENPMESKQRSLN